MWNQRSVYVVMCLHLVTMAFLEVLHTEALIFPGSPVDSWRQTILGHRSVLVCLVVWRWLGQLGLLPRHHQLSCPCDCQVLSLHPVCSFQIKTNLQSSQKMALRVVKMNKMCRTYRNQCTSHLIYLVILENGQKLAEKSHLTPISWQISIRMILTKLWNGSLPFS